MVNEHDVIGYAAALVSCIASGSFAVPIKCEAARKVEIDPFVLQSYKIFMTFLTCWLVLLPVVGVSFSFSPWGFVSGIFMVPGGTAGYYSVQEAGLATAQGIWCSCKVMVAFAWGLLVFGEPVRSYSTTTVSILLLIVGLVGMSYFSSQEKRNETVIVREDFLETALLDEECSMDTECAASADPTICLTTATSETSLDEGTRIRDSLRSFERENTTLLCTARSKKPRNRFWWGVCGALIDGTYGGSVLVPMHYARSEQTKGLSFLISFSIGCSVVLIAVWVFRLLFHTMKSDYSLSRGWKSLPSLHVFTVGPYALLAGFIWSIGNVAAIVSVAYLGQGVGYSLVQSQLLVAGLWGVLYYKEIRGKEQIQRWFVSAMVTVCGILLLSHEHLSLSK